MKKGNTVSSRRTAKLSFLVVGFLGLLLVNNGAFAQTSTPVFSDDFNRPDTTIADNGWVMKTARANIFSISNNQLVLSNGVVGATHSAYNITRPRSTAHLNQSASVDIIAGTPTTSEAGLLLRTNQAASDYVVVYLRANTFGIYDASSFLQNPTVSRDSSHSYRIIATIESTSELSSTITAKLIDLGVDGNSTIELKNITAIDTVLARQMSGSIGLFYNDRGTGGGIAIFDNFSGTTVSETVVYEPLSMNIDSPTVQFGTPINITISGDEDVVVTLQDTASGSFSSNSISLNNENAYTANVTYTPTKLGNITITATASDETLLTQEIFVSPYATVIGFIGDSITHGWGMSSTGLWAQNIAAKSLGMTAIDGAIGGATSSSWANNNVGSMYINAKTAFQATDVDIVHLMIGTNDCGTITPEKYKNYLQTLVDNLKIDGFKHLLISQPPYRNSNETCLDNLLGYQTAISTLVVENGGFVLLGDMTAYNVFENEYASLMGSDPHPNTAGQNRLGQLWAAAIKSVIDYQINPAHQFTGINGTSYTLGTTENLIFRVDKYFEEFNDVVKVDGVQLAASNYEATSGSTNIELNADYLNTLAVGDHTLTVGFEGGVQVEESFTILSEPTLPPVNPPTIPTNPITPTYAGGGGGGISLVKDSCPNGDLSPSYYDKTCGTTTNLTEEVEKKVNVLRPVIKLIYLTATEEQKTFVHNLITSCSKTNKNEIIKLACQELVKNRDF